MKIAIISIVVPPRQGGQSNVLYRLLKGLNPKSYCLITQKYAGNLFDFNCSERLPAPYYYVGPDNQITQWLVRIFLRLKQTYILDAITIIRSRQFRNILIKEKYDAVVACTGDLFDAPAAYLACRSLKIPFIFYAFDDYINQWTDQQLRSFARRYEPEFVNKAAFVIVPNECLSRKYKRRYGISPMVIHNPVDVTDYEASINESAKRVHTDKRIIYTGAIYDAHFDAFRNLIMALDHSDIPDVKLHLYTHQLTAKLRKQGISGPVVIHKALPMNCMPAIQRSADILFLPLAFHSPFPEVIRTSAPGKIGEYLASGRPILVHSPADSFISWYFKKYNCGIVVDEDDPKKLAQAVLHLLTDDDLKKKLIGNAYVQVRSDFDIQKAQEKFYGILDEMGEKG